MTKPGLAVPLWSIPRSRMSGRRLLQVYIVPAGTTDKAVWRNGSASDYESGGCSFEYYLGHYFSCFSSDHFLITIHDLHFFPPS